MTRTEEPCLLELINNPPRGSKVEAAKLYGVDLTLNLRRLALTPTQRAQEKWKGRCFLWKSCSA